MRLEGLGSTLTSLLHIDGHGRNNKHRQPARSRLEWRIGNLTDLGATPSSALVRCSRLSIPLAMDR
jgi:hypothetical protein